MPQKGDTRVLHVAEDAKHCPMEEEVPWVSAELEEEGQNEPAVLAFQAKAQGPGSPVAVEDGFVRRVGVG